MVPPSATVAQAPVTRRQRARKRRFTEQWDRASTCECLGQNLGKFKPMSLKPTEEELQAAPLLEGWVSEGSDASRLWIYAWFFGHPDIADGDHGHTSPVVEMDWENPPCWVRTDSRLYRLGNSYPPAEREIRYWAQKLRRRQDLPLGAKPGGSDDIEAMLEIIRNARPFSDAKIARMEQAFRDERRSAG